MPAQRPCASFDPISPDLDLAALVEETPSFEYVVRISCDMIEHQGLEAFEKLVLLHVIIGGKPLVIEGWQHRLDQWTFTSQWLRDNHGKKCESAPLRRLLYPSLPCDLVEQARNLTTKQNMALSIGHYLNNTGKLTNQWNAYNYKEPDRQRIYLKDIDCPEVWHDKLKEQIPASVFYLNDSTGDTGGPGSTYEANPNGPGGRNGRGAARAGDLMSCLPPKMRADNMMCYIGHEGTYTPAHREMCASLGHNLMVETSGALDDDGKPAKPGSSIWFMTETKDRHLVSEYWLSTLGHDIEVEGHFAQINAWKAAPFKTYIVEQKVGDFILIPPLAPHQVWNRGTRTMKAAWNRTTVETLEMALNEALPRARIVCRDEQYKNKAIVLFALEKYSDLLKQVDLQRQATTDQQVMLELNYSPKIRQLQKDFRRLFALYTQILLSEMLASVSSGEKKGQYLPYDSYVTCSYCRCNIFNRFLTCTSCVVPLENGEEDTYDICMECFAMGRSCRCISKYKWVEQFPWPDLVAKHELWRHQIIGFDGGLTDKAPQSLDVERKNLKKKTLAQVCQEQLKMRPWQDPTKEIEEEYPDEVLSDDARKLSAKSQRRRLKKARKDHMCCHVSHFPEPLWKLAQCKCGRAYTYGSLFRMFDLMPLTVMENPDWKCPHCLKICSCGNCRNIKGIKPFEPTGTMLGHDTKKVADPRSVESLVNFSISNIGWIKKFGDDDPHDTRRLRRRRDEAEIEKSKDPTLDDHYVNDEESTPVSSQAPVSFGYREGSIPIDPMLHESQPPPRPSRNVAQRDVESNHVNTPSDASGKDQWSRYTAPIARMMEENPRFGTFTTEDTGITYQYPDPTLPQTAPAPQVDRYPAQMSQNDDQQAPNTPQVHSGMKRKRSDSRIIVQSDAVNAATNDFAGVPRNDANAHYHHAKIQQTLAEARRNDRYISAEAAIYGRSLPVICRVPGSRLARIINKSHLDPLFQSDPGVSSIGSNAPDNVIVQSDFPVYSPASTAKPDAIPKKRKVRIDQDEDFSTRKAQHPKPSTTRLSLSEDLRKTSARYQEISSDTDSDQFEKDHAMASAQRIQKTRKLPAYLARKSDGDSIALPWELFNDPKPPSQPKMKPPNQHPCSTPNGTTKKHPLNHNHTPAPLRSSPTATPPPIDPHPASPLPTADASINLSELGPGATTINTIDPAIIQAEANRKAKLRALQWAESESDDNEADSEMERARVAEQAVKAMNAAKKKLQDGQPISAPPKGRAGREPAITSIFDRPGKKVKIASAVGAAVGNKEKVAVSAEKERRSLPGVL